MAPRSIDEPHRTATRLELLFDLTFVVAVASATGQLAHDIAAGHTVGGAFPFLQVFFAIWWAWMNFTWFASSYDTDDIPYRLLVLVQMAGVLVLASGVRAAATDGDFRAITVGYLIMRVGLVMLWLRAAREDPTSGATARRYAMGISIAEVGWLTRLALEEAALLPSLTARPIFVALVVLELVVPPWAERSRPTCWHPQHIAERYGLFAIILLGEGVLAASVGVDDVVASSGLDVPVVMTACAGLVLVFALWWLYFIEACEDGLAANRDRSYRWGYGHYGVFASLAALGGGLEVAVHHASDDTTVSPLTAAYAVAVPVAAFLVCHRAVSAAAVTSLIIPRSALSAATLTVLAVPLVAPVIGPAAVLAAIAAICAALVAAALLTSHDGPSAY